MKVNEKLANMEFHIKQGDKEIIGVTRKPNVDCKITHAIWFKGKASDFKKKENNQNDKIKL